MNQDTPKTKCGYVVIAGKPNAGKSTLVNLLLDANLSVVNPKAQTTRNKILGVLTKENYQIVFLDTPGMLIPGNELHNYMLLEIKSSLDEADVILYLIDAADFEIEEYKIIEKKYKKYFSKLKRIILLNKIDLITQPLAEKYIEEIKKEFTCESIIPISAANKFNTEKIIEETVNLLPDAPYLYDEDTLTDRSERFFVEEIIRNKILEIYQDEIPYSVYVDIREFKERAKGKDFINADIVLERDSQKSILLGKDGKKIKRLGREARLEIEKLLDRQVFLQLFVRIKKDWRKDKNILKSLFNK